MEEASSGAMGKILPRRYAIAEYEFGSHRIRRRSPCHHFQECAAAARELARENGDLCMKAAINPRILDVEESAAYIGISKSLFEKEYDGVYIFPIPLPGVNGKTIRTHLFDIRDLDDLIEKIKRGEIVCPSGDERERGRDVSSNRKDVTSITSDIPQASGKSRSLSRQKQTIQSERKQSVNAFYQKWGRGSRLNRIK